MSAPKHITTTRRDGKTVRRRIFGDPKQEAKEIMAEIRASKKDTLPSLENLNCSAVDVKPLDVDWNELGDIGDRWEPHEAAVCEKCGEAVNVGFGGNEAHKDIADSDCDGHVPSCEGPMMNYAYPLPHFQDDDGKGARALATLPVCLVVLDDQSYLALTGGGMDLSWEICEAYLTLGYYPPVHFCDLPAMSGRGESPKDKWIVQGCRESLRIMGTWLARRTERLDALVLEAAKAQRARMRAARKEIRP